MVSVTYANCLYRHVHLPHAKPWWMLARVAESPPAWSTSSRLCFCRAGVEWSRSGIDRHELRLDLIEGTGSGVISAHRWGGQTDRADKLMGIFHHQFAHTGATKAEFRTAAIDAAIANTTYYRALGDLLESGALVNTGTDQRPFYVKGGK